MKRLNPNEQNNKLGTEKPGPEVLMVGALPPPIGGVSTHISRLSTLLVKEGLGCTVVDAYPGEGKSIPMGVGHVLFKGQGSLGSALWLSMTLEKCGGDVIHLHFSRLVGRVLLTSCLLRKRRRKVILTLHHGDQQGVYSRANPLLRYLARVALSRMDQVVALSDEQATFYASIGVSKKRILRWRSELPSGARPDAKDLPFDLQRLCPIEAGGEETILMTSGYPNASYRYGDCIALLDYISAYFPCKLVVCLYGKGADPVYESALRLKLATHPGVIPVGPTSEAGFLALLAKASLYIRPSTVDSFGLAIVDALNVGTPCLASDICERDPRCQTFPTADRESFFARATQMVEESRKAGGRKASFKIDYRSNDEILACYRS